jgi:hypothetical protein
MHKFVQCCCRIGIFCNKTHLIHTIGPQTHVLGHFGPLHYYTNFGGKQAKLVLLMHKIVQQSRIRIFCSERTDPPHWTPKSYDLGCFKPFHYCTNFRAKWGELLHPNFSQRTHPIHAIGPRTHVLVRFVPFRYSTNFVSKKGKTGAINAQVRATLLCWNFS